MSTIASVLLNSNVSFNANNIVFTVNGTTLIATLRGYYFQKSFMYCRRPFELFFNADVLMRDKILSFVWTVFNKDIRITDVGKLSDMQWKLSCTFDEEEKAILEKYLEEIY